MRYSFDAAKRAVNLAKHGLDLADAERVIGCNVALTLQDLRYEYGEDRFLTIAPLDGKLVVVITAEQDEHIRVISMREATSYEKETYRCNSG
jgi:uncharacterized DUF497 family protein